MKKSTTIGCLLLAADLAVLAQAGESQERRAPVLGSPESSIYTPSKTPPPPVSQPMRVVFMLAGYDRTNADAFVRSQYTPGSPNFHQWISLQQFAKRFGASDYEVSLVSSYLRANGFQDIKTSSNRMFLSAEAGMSDVSRTFNTHFGFYERPTQQVQAGESATFYAPTAPPTLPASVASHVSGVIGLTDLFVLHPLLEQVQGQTANIDDAQKPTSLPGAGSGFLPPAGGPPSGYLTPPLLSSAYNFNAVHRLNLYGDGHAVGVFSPTLRYTNDPYAFASQFGISGFSLVDYAIDGGPSSSTVSSGGPIEAALDIEMIIGQAPHAKIVLACPSGTPQGWLDAYSFFGQEGIPVVTSSWGLAEYALYQSGSAGTVVAQAFADTTQSLAAAGITLLQASGDSGAFGDPQFPTVINTVMEASLPYVTGVGGTDLNLTSSGAYSSETAWSYDASNRSGGGGGLSHYFARPAWQSGPGVLNSFSNGMRQVPDVAAASGVPIQIYAAGSWMPVWGTSAASPLWAAGVLLMDEYYSFLLHQSNIGMGSANPALYWLGNEFENAAIDQPGMFYLYHDVRSGWNGFESATASWDFCTGWGSVDFYKLLVDMGNYYALPGLGADYAPYDPSKVLSGWNKPVMIHTSTTSVVEPLSFKTSQTLYFAVSIANLGDIDAPQAEHCLYIDGKPAKAYYWPPLATGYLFYNTGIYSTKLAAGKHTVELVANLGHKARESNYANNVYVRTITVAAG